MSAKCLGKYIIIKFTSDGPIIGEYSKRPCVSIGNAFVDIHSMKHIWRYKIGSQAHNLINYHSFPMFTSSQSTQIRTGLQTSEQVNKNPPQNK